MLRITYLRRSLGLSQTKLGQRADVNPVSICKIENGKEPIYPHRGKRIARVLGWNGPVEALLDEVEKG